MQNDISTTFFSLKQLYLLERKKKKSSSSLISSFSSLIKPFWLPHFPSSGSLISPFWSSHFRSSGSLHTPGGRRGLWSWHAPPRGSGWRWSGWLGWCQRRHRSLLPCSPSSGGSRPRCWWPSPAPWPASPPAHCLPSGTWGLVYICRALLIYTLASLVQHRAVSGMCNSVSTCI